MRAHRRAVVENNFANAKQSLIKDREHRLADLKAKPALIDVCVRCLLSLLPSVQSVRLSRRTAYLIVDEIRVGRMGGGVDGGRGEGMSYLIPTKLMRSILQHRRSRHNHWWFCSHIFLRALETLPSVVGICRLAVATCEIPNSARFSEPSEIDCTMSIDQFLARAAKSRGNGGRGKDAQRVEQGAKGISAETGALAHFHDRSRMAPISERILQTDGLTAHIQQTCQLSCVVPGMLTPRLMK